MTDEIPNLDRERIARAGEEPQRELADFAAAAPIGTPCRYYPVAGRPEGIDPENDEFVETRIRSEPWLLGHGAVVVMVEGVRGGVSIKHIRLPGDEAA